MEEKTTLDPKKIMLSNLPLAGFGYHLLKEYIRLGVTWLVFIIILILFWSWPWQTIVLLIYLFYTWVCYDCYDLVKKINSGQHQQNQEDTITIIGVGILVFTVFLVVRFLLR